MEANHNSEQEQKKGPQERKLNVNNKRIRAKGKNHGESAVEL